MSKITGDMLRAARSLLGITAKAAAAGAGVSEPTYNRYEAAGPERPNITVDRLEKIEVFFESLGVTFIHEPDRHGAVIDPSRRAGAEDAVQAAIARNETTFSARVSLKRTDR